MADSLWGNVNTCVEIGFEIYRLMLKSGASDGFWRDAEVKKIADGVLLMSNDKEILLAVSKDTASQALSDTAVSYGVEKDGHIIYSGAMTAIPLYELSKTNDAVRDYIVNEESLRATLCGNYPEYVKTHNMAALPEAQIEDTDAPPYLFLQKQLDNAADKTRSEVAEYQAARNYEADRGYGMFEDVLELER